VATDSLARHLAWEACYNVRDLGGFPTEDGRQTRWRALVRADTLCRLTEAGQRALLDYGVRTVIDLRLPEEVEREPNPFASLERSPAIRYLHLPLIDPAVASSLADLPTAAERYIAMLEGSPERMAAIMRAVADAPEGGALFHCAAGKDRTGIIAALLLRLSGVPEDVIADDYVATDQFLAPLAEEWVAAAPDEAERERRRGEGLRGETIVALLRHLDATYGGVERYLRSLGLSEVEIGRLRRRLL
jgi:protein-tyrosine phosphatase